MIRRTMPDLQEQEKRKLGRDLGITASGAVIQSGRATVDSGKEKEKREQTANSLEFEPVLFCHFVTPFGPKLCNRFTPTSCSSAAGILGRRC